MKRPSLPAIAAVVLIANSFALFHAWKNRSGPVDAEITLTQRELIRVSSVNSEDNGVSLYLQWNNNLRRRLGDKTLPWQQDPAIHRAFGFDTSTGPDSPDALDFYHRQRPRLGFAALEYDGPAWRALAEELKRDNERVQRPDWMAEPAAVDSASRLVIIDAAPDAARLRARHPDRNSVVILPVVVQIAAQGSAKAHDAEPATPGYVAVWIREILTEIHVPKPYSDAFHAIDALHQANPRYRVRLRYGSNLEPWIVGVEAESVPDY